MNTAVVGGAQGIGFAIPVDEIKDAIVNLLSSPRVTALWFGATLDQNDSRPGARIERVETGSPAAQSGLKPGDLIITADGAIIREPLELSRYMNSLRADHRLSLGYRRDGAERQAAVILITRPKPTPSKLISERMGLSCQDLNAKLASQLNLYVNQGVLINDHARRPGGARGIGARRRHRPGWPASRDRLR